jgi:hypothetical protein
LISQSVPVVPASRDFDVFSLRGCSQSCIYRYNAIL